MNKKKPQKPQMKQIDLSSCEVPFISGQPFNFGQFTLDTLALMKEHNTQHVICDIYVDGEFIFQQKTAPFVEMFSDHWKARGNSFDESKSTIEQMIEWEKKHGLFQPMKVQPSAKKSQQKPD